MSAPKCAERGCKRAARGRVGRTWHFLCDRCEAVALAAFASDTEGVAAMVIHTGARASALKGQQRVFRRQRAHCSDPFIAVVHAREARAARLALGWARRGEA